MPEERESELVKCPFCEGLISPTATKCKHCGEWVKASRAGAAPSPAAPAPPPTQAPAYAPPPTQYVYAPSMAPTPVNVTVKTPGSVAFAVVAMMLMIFVYPVGLLLSLIGLISGPRRGCFLSLLLVGVLLPAGSTALLLYTGVRTGVPQVDQQLDDLRERLRIHQPQPPERPPAEAPPSGRSGGGSSRLDGPARASFALALNPGRASRTWAAWGRGTTVS